MKKKTIIEKEIVIDQNLYFLENFLYMLDGFTFDEDVEFILNELKEIVIDKLYSDSLEKYDILNSEFKIKYFLEK